MAKKNLAEIFVDTPLAAGANGVHGVAGGSLNGITEAFVPTRASDEFMSSTKKRPHLLLERRRI